MSSSPSFLVIGNCQVLSIGVAIDALVPGARKTLLSCHDYGAPDIEDHFRSHDHIFVQQAHVSEPVRVLQEKYRSKVKLLPKIVFSGFHPDIAFVKRDREELRSPMREYHSTLVFAGWMAGLSRERIAMLFCREVFETLGFFDAMDASLVALDREFQSCGLDLSSFMAKWVRYGSNFMHTINHPKLIVSLTLTEELARRCGIKTAPISPHADLFDPLGHFRWPVYPGIGSAYGERGSTNFINYHLPPNASGFSGLSLEAYIDQCCAIYDQHGKDRLYCARFETSLFRNFVQELRHEFGDDASAGQKQRHPYQGLPARQFWSKSVAGVAPAEVDPVMHLGFRIEKHTRIATAGSCFAQHMARVLQEKGFHYYVAENPPRDLAPQEARVHQYGTYSARYGNIYTTRQLSQLFDRAFGMRFPEDEVWQRPDGRFADPYRPQIEPTGFATKAELHASREIHLAAVRDLFKSAEVFVFTLGLTEAWQAKSDGSVFPLAPGVAAGAPDSSKYEFINFTPGEIAHDLNRFLQKLRWINPGVKVILTVSPVPLTATYENQHVLVSNTYSKAALRVVAEEAVRKHREVYYFPSYEIITGNFNRGAYYENDLREVTSEGVDHVMRLFVKHFCAPENEMANTQFDFAAEINEVSRLVCEEQLNDADAAKVA